MIQSKLSLYLLLKILGLQGKISIDLYTEVGFPGGSVVKNPPVSIEGTG